MDPIPLLRKDQEETIAAQMKEKYNVLRDKRGFHIASIKDYTVRFVAKVLASKLLAELCAKGLHIN